jgi:hypothetical protein
MTGHFSALLSSLRIAWENGKKREEKSTGFLFSEKEEQHERRIRRDVSLTVASVQINSPRVIERETPATEGSHLQYRVRVEGVPPGRPYLFQESSAERKK